MRIKLFEDFALLGDACYTTSFQITTNMSKVTALFTFALVALSVASNSNDVWIEMFSIQMTQAVENDLPLLPELAKNLGLNSLYKSIVKAKLADALSAAGPFTVFGPTDAAFRALPEWAKKAITNVTVLSKVLEYHVINGKISFSDLENMDEKLVDTLIGKPLRVNFYPNNKVITAQCSPIDPNNADKMASNGVLHEIARVVIPPPGTIVDAITACPVFKTLVKAIAAADLTSSFSEEGPFTLFAPTDAAFEKLPSGELDKLLKNKTLLVEVLMYHTVPLTYCSPGLVSYTNLTTLIGQTLAVAVSGDRIKINNAQVIPNGADGSVTNGVVHAIDQVLLPPDFLRRSRV